MYRAYERVRYQRPPRLVDAAVEVREALEVRQHPNGASGRPIVGDRQEILRDSTSLPGLVAREYREHPHHARYVVIGAVCGPPKRVEDEGDVVERARSARSQV